MRKSFLTQRQSAEGLSGNCLCYDFPLRLSFKNLFYCIIIALYALHRLILPELLNTSCSNTFRWNFPSPLMNETTNCLGRSKLSCVAYTIVDLLRNLVSPLTFRDTTARQHQSKGPRFNWYRVKKRKIHFKASTCHGVQSRSVLFKSSETRAKDKLKIWVDKPKAFGTSWYPKQEVSDSGQIALLSKSLINTPTSTYQRRLSSIIDLNPTNLMSSIYNGIPLIDCSRNSSFCVCYR